MLCCFLTMKFETLLSNSKWDILTAVAKRERSASEIARATKTSLANISQQTKLLEALGYLRREDDRSGKRGRPRTTYSLKKEVAHLALLTHGFAGKKELHLDDFHTMILRLWFFPTNEDHYYLQKFFWQEEAFITECTALAIVETNRTEIHLLALVPEEKLAHFREAKSKSVVYGQHGKKSIIIWTHTTAELEEGIARKEPYFLNLLKKPHIIKDEQQLLQQLLHARKRGEE